jgi:hypothetical protein
MRYLFKNLIARMKILASSVLTKRGTRGLGQAAALYLGTFRKALYLVRLSFGNNRINFNSATDLSKVLREIYNASGPLGEFWDLTSMSLDAFSKSPTFISRYAPQARLIHNL